MMKNTVHMVIITQYPDITSPQIHLPGLSSHGGLIIVLWGSRWMVVEKLSRITAPSKALFSTKNYWYSSYFCMKIYCWDNQMHLIIFLANVLFLWRNEKIFTYHEPYNSWMWLFSWDLTLLSTIFQSRCTCVWIWWWELMALYKNKATLLQYHAPLPLPLPPTHSYDNTSHIILSPVWPVLALFSNADD